MKVSEVTQEMIEQWKQQYPAVYKIKLSGQEFYFRPITRREMLELQRWVQSNPDSTVGQMDEKVVEMCLLWPQWKIADFLALPAGIISTLSRRIQDRSGFDTEDSDLAVFDNISIPELSNETVASLKRQYERFAVVRMGNLQFAVRPVSRVEWMQIQSSSQSADPDADVVRIGLLHPDLNTVLALPAGYVAILSNVILTLSGFNEQPEVEEVL